MAAALLLGAVPSQVEANSLKLTLSPDTVTEETEVVVTATGSTDDDYWVGAKLVPASRGCPAYQRAANVASRNFAFADDRIGGFRLEGTVGPNAPGQYLVCGWIQRSFDSLNAYTRAEVPLRVDDSSIPLPEPNPNPNPEPIPEPDPDLGRCEGAKTALNAAKRQVTSARQAIRGKKGKAKAKAKQRYRAAVKARERAQGRVDALC